MYSPVRSRAPLSLVSTLWLAYVRSLSALEVSMIYKPSCISVECLQRA